jgi:hypothetical protein
LERGSDKHSPRVDEQLDHDTRSLRQGAPVESRVEEHREQEGPGRGPADPRCPADREALVADAEANQAPARVVERLQARPAGRDFENVQDIWSALGGTDEHRF